MLDFPRILDVKGRFLSHLTLLTVSLTLALTLAPFSLLVWLFIFIHNAFDLMLGYSLSFLDSFIEYHHVIFRCRIGL